MQKFKILFVCGTRPEAIKLAPVVLRLCKQKKIDTKVCLTGQHENLYEEIFSIFNIKKEIFTELQERKAEDLVDLTTSMLQKINLHLSEEKYNLILVHGDTASAFCGALCAFYNKIPLCHIESGLRTNKKYFPFPEEVFRKFVDSVADIHFCPTKSNLENLKKENIDTSKAFIVGNTILDVVKKNKNKFNKRKIILVTLHRRELWGTKFEKILDCLNKLAKKFKKYKIYYILNKNKNLQNIVKNKFKKNKNIKILHDLSFTKFHDMIKKSEFVITDSGGLQEECAWLETPIFVLRNETERPELIKKKSGLLLTTKAGKVYNIINKYLKQKNIKFKKNKRLFGDGKSSKKITKKIIKIFKNTI